MCYIRDQILGFFLPEINVKVVIQNFNFNVSLPFNLQKIVDVLLIEKSDVDSFFSGSSSPA